MSKKYYTILGVSIEAGYLDHKGDAETLFGDYLTEPENQICLLLEDGKVIKVAVNPKPYNTHQDAERIAADIQKQIEG